MKLTRIKYSSALFFLVFTWVIYLVMNVILFVTIKKNPVLASQLGPVSFVGNIVLAPIIGGVIGYLIALLAIFVYNLIAKKYPIAWEVGK